MKRITTVATSLAFCAAALAACGSKKPAAKAPAATTSDAPAATDTTTPPATDKGAETPAGTNANLNNTVYFEFDSSTLSADARAKLDENGEWLRQDAKRKLTIEGHTDEVGTPEYNLGLGERRARTAQEYLVRLGIDASRIQIITYGEERPASADDAQNRRSMFIATQKDKAAAK
jgi:peptidoglycan-associated lipoprotein